MRGKREHPDVKCPDVYVCANIDPDDENESMSVY